MSSEPSNNEDNHKQRQNATEAAFGMWKDRDDLDWITERKDRLFPGWSDREPEQTEDLKP